MTTAYRGSGLITSGLLYSVEFPQASSTCQLSFWHVNYGGQSPITTSLTSNGIKEGLLYRFDSNGNSTSWRFASVDLGTIIRDCIKNFKLLTLILKIGRINRPFQILFEGIRSIANSGWVAVDDISLDNCQLLPTNRTCTGSEFKCDRGSCVGQDRLCDIVDDCGDNSDETRTICSSFSK